MLSKNKPQSRFRKLNRFLTVNRNVAFKFRGNILNKQIDLFGEVLMKKCPRCKILKLKNKFRKHNGRYRDGLRAWCKKCDNEAGMKYYRKNRKRILAKRRHEWIYNAGGGHPGEKKTIKNLTKRPYPNNKICELCNRGPFKLSYHHWADQNPNWGIWLCFPCHQGCNFVERNLIQKYLEFKKEIEVSPY